MPADGRDSRARFSPDGSVILTTNQSKAMQLWDVKTCKQVGEPVRLDDYLSSTAFSPNSKSILIGFRDGTIKRLDIASRTLDKIPINLEGPVQSLAFSPNGTAILTMSPSGSAGMWDLTGNCLGETEGSSSESLPPWRPSAAVFDHQGKRILITTPRYNRIIPVTGLYSPRRRLKGEDVDLEIAAMLDHGQMSQVTPTTRNLPVTQPPEKGDTASRVAEGRNGSVKDSVMAPDGKRYVELRDDDTIRFYEPKVHQELAILRLEEPALSIQFAPDGSQLVIRLADNTALVWDTRGPGARPDDRASRSAIRAIAEKYVEDLLAGPLPIADVESSIRNNSKNSQEYRLVAMKVLRERMLEFDVAAQPNWDKLIEDSVTRASLKVAVESWKPPSNERPAYFNRIHEALLKKVAELDLDSRKLNNWAWGKLWAPKASPECVQEALRAAHEAVRGAAMDGECLTTLGVAQFRTGQLEEAIQTLRLASELGNGSKTISNAFIAMSAFRLGRSDEARATLMRNYVSSHSGNYLDGTIKEGVLRFTYSISKTKGEGWFKLSQDGMSFAGKWKMEGEEEWNSWTARRKAGRDPGRFDGLWDATFVDLWMSSDGNTVRGQYGVDTFTAEAITLIEGDTSIIEPMKFIDSPQEASFNSSTDNPPSISSPTSQPYSR